MSRCRTLQNNILWSCLCPHLGDWVHCWVWCFFSPEIWHCPIFSQPILPAALIQLTLVQVKESSRSLLLPLSPAAFVPVLVGLNMDDTGPSLLLIQCTDVIERTYEVSCLLVNWRPYQVGACPVHGVYLSAIHPRTHLHCHSTFCPIHFLVHHATLLHTRKSLCRTGSQSPGRHWQDWV